MRSKWVKSTTHNTTALIENYVKRLSVSAGSELRIQQKSKSSGKNAQKIWYGRSSGGDCEKNEKSSRSFFHSTIARNQKEFGTEFDSEMNEVYTPVSHFVAVLLNEFVYAHTHTHMIRWHHSNMSCFYHFISFDFIEINLLNKNNFCAFKVFTIENGCMASSFRASTSHNLRLVPSPWFILFSVQCVCVLFAPLCSVFLALPRSFSRRTFRFDTIRFMLA